MLKAAITGGIGSGKSLVCEIFRYLGVPSYNADDKAKWIMENDKIVRGNIIRQFGEGAYDENALNKSFLANVVFTNKEALQIINSIVHPVVMGDFIQWCTHSVNHPYALIESALAFQIGVRESLDVVIVVTAPELIRIERVMKRDGLSEQQAKLRMTNQMEEAKMIAMADEVIVNDGKTLLLPQVMRINERLISI